MIYLVEGNDNKKKNSFLKTIYEKEKPIIISKEEASRELILSYAESRSLFGDKKIFLMEDFIKEGVVSFSKEELALLEPAPFNAKNPSANFVSVAIEAF